MNEEKVEAGAGETNAQPEAPTEQRPHDHDLDHSGISGVALTIAEAAAPVISAAKKPVESLTQGARWLIGERPGARVRAVRRMAREPLANLWDVHLEARRASIRELGLRSVPVETIAGTAVEGPAQRGGDFLPLRDRRSDDWRSRWQRILRGVEGMATLPPVELIKFGDQYWVVDGHNRVAAALYTGQVELDAIVQELRLPGMPFEPPTLIAPALEGSLDLRNAGAGRFSRTASRPDNRPPRRDNNTDNES